MTIEVKQMLIKSNVLQKLDAEGEARKSCNDTLKEEVLEECRELIIEMLREEKER